MKRTRGLNPFDKKNPRHQIRKTDRGGLSSQRIQPDHLGAESEIRVKAIKSKTKHEWKKLEKRALRLVSKDLQANYSAGGPRCKLSGYQVDAYGIFGRVAIVFECKTTAADRRININKAVDQLAGRRPAICRALQERHGRQLKYFRFVIIVGNASEIVPYTQRSRKPKDIYVWRPKIL